jgi:DNA-binding NtrC family response regulator
MRHEPYRVLLVDDEPAICFAYSKLLESEQFGFDICNSVETALEHLKKNDYFAVISDVRFAGSDNEDGVCFMSVVRKERPQAKVLLVTGYGSDELKKKALALGVAHYIEKPVCPTLILGILRNFSDAACAAFS